VSQSSDVFKHLTDEECEALVGEMRDAVRPLYKQLETVAAATLRVRPVFLGKQPFPKRCQMIKKAMALKSNSESGGDVLAAFFLERHAKEVSELLDAFGVEHEEGALKQAAPPQPAKKKLEKVVKEFLEGENAVLRSVLLKSFAAQSAVDWPALDAMLFPALQETGGAK
jgi:hypothetical protein